jgi:hypothetical protein
MQAEFTCCDTESWTNSNGLSMTVNTPWASLRGDDEDGGGYLIGPADWLGIASNTEPFFELRLPDGRSGACFVSEFDRAATTRRVTIAGVGPPTLRLKVLNGRQGTAHLSSVVTPALDGE